MKRDFSYVDDVVESVARIVQKEPATNYNLYNVGNHSPVELMEFIEVLESCLGKKAIKEFFPLQDGDVVETYADVSELVEAIGFSPSTPIQHGVGEFVKWYKSYYPV
jgi:UDP-glucuronate 4-epimerase